MGGLVLSKTMPYEDSEVVALLSWLNRKRRFCEGTWLKSILTNYILIPAPWLGKTIDETAFTHTVAYHKPTREY